MSFYFAWLEPRDLFDPQRHARQHEELLHFHIDHDQGAIPLLYLTVPAVSYTPKKNGQRGVLWQQEGKETHLLFDGLLVGNPAEHKEDFLLLILEAGRSDKKERLEKALTIQKKKQFEPLLVAEEDQEAVEEILEAGSVLPHWDRITGEVNLVDIYDGGEKVDVGPDFFADSLELSEKGRHFSKIHCSVTSEWVQRYDGVADISPLIRQAGIKGYLSTLTPQGLSQRWWKKDYPLHRTGYEILESTLVPLTPPSTGGLNLYPLKSTTFTVGGVLRTVPRMWFMPTLKIQWHYQQKRKEIVHIEVPYAEKGEKLDLSLRLQNICSPIAVPLWVPNHLYPVRSLVRHGDSVYCALTPHKSGGVFDPLSWEKKSSWPTALEDVSQWSFFNTFRGRQVLNHLVQRLYAYGFFLGPRLEVRCRLPFALGRQLRGHQQIHLTDPRLPGGKFVGDIEAYQLIAEGDTGERWAEVKAVLRRYANPAKTIKKLQSIKKAEGILEPSKMTADDLVHRIQLIHEVEDQNKRIEGKKFEHLSSVHKFLETIPTRLRIELKDLKRTGELSHEWKTDLG